MPENVALVDDAAIADSGGVSASARRQATRQRLIAAAVAEITERGFHATSIEHITDRAGFTRGAFYSNFDSKEQLFAEALLLGREALLVDLRERLGAVNLPAARRGRVDSKAVELAVDHILRGLPRDPTWFVLNAEADLLAVRDPAFAQATGTNATAFLDEIGALLAATLNGYGMGLAIAPGQLVRVLFGYFSTALREAVFDGRGDEVWLPEQPHARVMAALLVALVEPLPG